MVSGDDLLFDKRSTINRNEVGVYCRNRIYFDMRNRAVVLRLLFEREDEKVMREWNIWKLRRKDFERMKRIKIGV